MMVVFDDITVYMGCPFCGEFVGFATQTKDLGCGMFHYYSLPDNWFISEMGRKFRTGLSVFPSFPLDKGASVWESQAEKTEAQATIDAEIASQLKYVNITTDCPKCCKYFDGKIHIQGDKLMGEIYDAVEWKPRKGVDGKVKD